MTLDQLVNWLLEYPEILAALVTFGLAVAWQLATRVFAAKPKLRWGLTSDTVFLVPLTPEPQPALPAGAAAAPADEAETPPPRAQVPDQPAATQPTGGIQALPPHAAYRARNLWLVNTGSAAAEDVELAFNWPPQHMEWYPHLPTTVTRQPDGRHILTISRLNPKEGVNFSLLSLNQEHPGLMHVRCKGHGAKRIEFRRQQIFPLWLNLLVGGLMLLGVYTIVSIIIAVAVWLL